MLMELRAFQVYKSPDLTLAYWRTSSGQEVDFILPGNGAPSRGEGNRSAALEGFSGAALGRRFRTVSPAAVSLLPSFEQFSA